MVIKQLSEIRNKIKAIKIRQMRQKGIVIEVSGKEVKLINSMNTDEIGLEIEESKRLSPSIVMIYDVDEKYTKEELKEDFIRKNFDLSTQDQAKLFDKIKFLKCFKTRNNCVNWIVQIPGGFLEDVLAKGKIYMACQIY